MKQGQMGATSLGMNANLEALLCYLLGFVTGIVFYLAEKQNKFVRFHAMQSIIVFGFLFVLGIILPLIPIIGWILIPLLWITNVVLWVLLMLKAYQGEKFKIPVAGDMAEKNS